ncbi:MAG: hypothetical protein WAW60_01675 [Candidatus Saccharimonadales bacterium]
MDQQELQAKLLPRLQVSHLTDQQVAEFCGVATITAHDWRRGKTPPNGERQIKLWYLLELDGANSPEVKTIPPLQAYVRQLFALGIMDMPTVMEAFRLSKSQSVYYALRGGKLMSPSVSLDDLKEMYESTLQTTKLRFVRLRGEDGAAPDVSERPVVTAKPNRVTVTSPQISLESDPVLMLASLLGAALPMIRHLNSDGATPEARSRLRRLMGDGGVFELSNHFNALCSERARNQGRS